VVIYTSLVKQKPDDYQLWRKKADAEKYAVKGSFVSFSTTSSNLLLNYHFIILINDFTRHSINSINYRRIDCFVISEVLFFRRGFFIILSKAEAYTLSIL